MTNIQNFKLCTKCKLQLEHNRFYSNKSARDGLQSWCKECWSKCRPRYVEHECLTCYKLFNAPVKEVNRGNGKYCSVSCGRLRDRPKKIHESNVVCAHCNMPFYVDNKRKSASKSGLHFCCREHKDIAQRIGGIEAIQPDHYGRADGINTYREVAFRNYPKVCMRCGYDKFVVVHHKDRNRENNELENLEILCPNCHALEHWAK